MANLIAARDALERFSSDLPAAGLVADRLRRTAEATRALFDQAVSNPDASTAWCDHNVAVLIADGLSEASTTEAAMGLFLGTRRRLSAALDADPDDLAAALALALGSARATSDPRMAPDVGLVAAALGRPQAGPRLVAAAVGMVVAAGRSGDDAVAAAAGGAVEAVRAGVERVVTSLPNHPDAVLDRARLDLQAARRADGDARQQLLDSVHGAIRDHGKRFGATSAARGLLSELLEFRARTGGAPADVRKEAVAVFEAQVADSTLRPKQADRLVRALERAKALDQKTARHLLSLVEGFARDVAHWRKTITRLLERSGDEARLRTAWESALTDGSDNGEAAAGLSRQLIRNLRANLPMPFSNEILGKLLEGLQPKQMARWSAADVDAVLAAIAAELGTASAAAFARDKLLTVRELRKRDGLWKRALDLTREVGDEDAVLDVARRAVKEGRLPSARLLLARSLLARDTGEALEEAEAVLRPLYDVKGEVGAAAHDLRKRLSGHPRYRQVRHDQLVAFEERIGVGSDKPFLLKVIHTAPKYALVEVYEHHAPDVYEHRHLRTMLRAGRDLPANISPLHLRKGDKLKGTLRGQDADASRDRDGLRVYWIADSSGVRMELSPEAIQQRLDKEEMQYRIGAGKPAALRVLQQGKKGDLVARILHPGRGPEFVERAVLKASQLPAGVRADALGKGKRFWAPVARLKDAGEDGRRCYEVLGKLSQQDPEAAAATEAPAERAAEAGAPQKKAKKSKLDAPKADAPKDDAPRADASKADAPKADAPADAPKADAPKADAPKADAPKADAPKADGAGTADKPAEAAPEASGAPDEATAADGDDDAVPEAPKADAPAEATDEATAVPDGKDTPVAEEAPA